MLRNDPNFRRVAKRMATVDGHQECWLGPDHILVVEVNTWLERYKRFYYRDIHAIVLEQTRGWIWTSLFLGAAFVLFGLIALLGEGFAVRIAFAILASLFLIALVWNGSCGPSCRFFIQTSAGRQRIGAVSRFRRGEHTMEELKNRIQAAQGILTPETIAACMEEQQSVSANPVAVATPEPPPVAAPRPKIVYSGRAHVVLFGACLVNAPVTLLALAFPEAAEEIAGPWLAILAGLAVWALIRQSHSTMPGRLRTLPWACLGILLLTLVFGFVYGIYLGIHLAFEAFQDPANHPAVLVWAGISTLATAAVGVLGLVELRKYRSRSAAVPPPLDDIAR